MIDLMISAIQQRKFVSFTYSGLPRVAQPAAVGLSAKGNPVLRCFQTEGGHITPGHEWDLCEIARISSLHILDITFSIDPPGYKKGDRHMRPVYAEL